MTVSRARVTAHAIAEKQKAPPKPLHSSEAGRALSKAEQLLRLAPDTAPHYVGREAMKTELIQALGRATEGQCIAWINPRCAELTDAFQAADQAYDGPGWIRRVNGGQEITPANGGRIQFITPAGVRGSTFDRAYVPTNISDEELMAIIPALDTSKDGAIIYY